AVDSGRPIVPVYVVDEQDSGGATRWWLQNSLASLDAALRKGGAGLVVRFGRPGEVIPDLVTATGASGLYFANRHEPLARDQERMITEALAGQCDIRQFADSYLVRPLTLC
ncbi:MAG: deoxyribodipyrimidine photo-lyase, partial [Planctomycetales bacterium]|nr:deoxyribodipyrimidine photo-lyase [Planctomycetales bacterium]